MPCGDYIIISFGITGPIVVSLKMEFYSYTLEDLSSVANFITAYEVSVKLRLPFPICKVFFVSKGNIFFTFVCTAQFFTDQIKTLHILWARSKDAHATLVFIFNRLLLWFLLVAG